MNRKWTVLGSTAGALLAVVGLGFAADEGSPLHKVMEKVQAHNTTIVKGVRNATAYKKAQGDVAKAAEELVKLGKEAKPLTDAAKNAKDVDKPLEKWATLTDEFIKEAETFAGIAAKQETTQAQAKDAYKAVSKKCSSCHEVFRIDDAGY